MPPRSSKVRVRPQHELKPKLKPQHAPKPPHEDAEFLESTPARPLRIMAEYLQPLMQLKKENIGDTIVMFGSARIESRETALARYTRLKKRNTAKLGAKAGSAHRLALSSAKSALEMSRYYEEARELSHKITSWASSLGPKPRRFVICSGGGPGIMEAANRGAHEVGAKTIGLNIQLPFEQHPNPYITPELSFDFHYFFMRKYWFAYLAKALVVFPGGFGTLDEMFELLTLAQTRKLAKTITVVIYGSDYWKHVINLELLAEKGAIAMSDLELFKFADTPEDAFTILKAGLTEHLDSEYERMQRRLESGEGMTSAQAPGAEAILGPDIAKTR